MAPGQRHGAHDSGTGPPFRLLTAKQGVGAVLTNPHAGVILLKERLLYDSMHWFHSEVYKRQCFTVTNSWTCFDSSIEQAGLVGL